MQQEPNAAPDAVPPSARAEAARRNGAKSQGPKTDAGKQRSSQNAIKHGMYCRDIVVPGESLDEYHDLRDSYLQEFHPSGPAEAHQVQTMIDAEWRINRFRQSETAVLTRRIPNESGTPANQIANAVARDVLESTTLKAIYQFEPRLQRDYDRALRRLLELQKRRTAAATPRKAEKPPVEKQQNEPKPAAAAATSSTAPAAAAQPESPAQTHEPPRERSIHPGDAPQSAVPPAAPPA
jgi:hypothetical protein